MKLGVINSYVHVMYSYLEINAEHLDGHGKKLPNYR